jgi:hypothetical protein
VVIFGNLARVLQWNAPTARDVLKIKKVKMETKNEEKQNWTEVIISLVNKKGGSKEGGRPRADPRSEKHNVKTKNT